ncbi:MAG: hypothetical protein ABIS51_15365 [Sphingomonas sp.]
MRKFTLVAALMLAGLTVSGCRYGHPGHDSDRHGRGHHHDRDHDGPDRYR